MKSIIIALSVLLVVALAYDLHFYRRAKVFHEDLLTRNKSDEKNREDFANTKSRVPQFISN